MAFVVRAFDPIVMPRLTRAQGRRARSRSIPRAPLAVPALGWRLSSDPPGGEGCGPDPVRVTITLDGCPFTVRCPRRAVAGILAALEAELDADQLPATLAGLVLEAALLPAIEAFTHATGKDARILSVEGEGDPGRVGVSPDDAVILSLDDGHARRVVRIAAEPGAGHTLDDLLALWPRAPRPMDGLPFPTVMRLGTTPLALADLLSLRLGDAVLLDVRHPGAGMLVIAEAWLAEAAPEGEAWRLTTALRPAASHDDRKWTMQDEGDWAEDAAPVNHPDALPVRVAFDVGRIELSLGDLRNLDIGAVLELGRQPEGLVRISANGRAVGQGTLVDVDGAVGVRIVRMFDLV